MYGPLYSGESGGLDESSLMKTCVQPRLNWKKCNVVWFQGCNCRMMRKNCGVILQN